MYFKKEYETFYSIKKKVIVSKVKIFTYFKFISYFIILLNSMKIILPTKDIYFNKQLFIKVEVNIGRYSPCPKAVR